MAKTKQINVVFEILVIASDSVYSLLEYAALKIGSPFFIGVVIDSELTVEYSSLLSSCKEYSPSYFETQKQF